MVTFFNFTMNLLFIAIPQISLSMFIILFLLKEYRYFETGRFKKTIADVLIIGTLMSSLTVSFLAHYTNLSLLPRLGLNSIILFIFTIHLLKQTSNCKTEKPFPISDIKNFRRETASYIYTIEDYDHKLKYKKKLKAYWYSVNMILFIIVVEFAAVLYSQYIFSLDINKITSNIFNSMVIAYPGIIILIFSVYLCYVYTNTRNVTIFKIWKSNKKFRILTYAQAFTTLSVSILIYNFILKDNTILNLDSNFVLKISIGFYILLILHIIIPWTLICRKELIKYRLMRKESLS